MEGFVYELPPIDWWIGWTLAKTIKADRDALETGANGEIVKALRTALKEILERTSWEGDFGEGPRVIGLPHENEPEFSLLVVGFKQQNNGTTFIWSPVQLPWLAKWAR